MKTITEYFEEYIEEIENDEQPDDFVDFTEESWAKVEKEFDGLAGLSMLEIISSKRPGPKSGAQTPAEPNERRSGSSKNKPGSASSPKTGKSIELSPAQETSLKNKVEEYNKSNPSSKVTLGQLKSVWRRGAGAFSSSHRTNQTRSSWAMARVNTFLKMIRGNSVKESYKKADIDLATESQKKKIK